MTETTNGTTSMATMRLTGAERHRDACRWLSAPATAPKSGLGRADAGAMCSVSFGYVGNGWKRIPSHPSLRSLDPSP